MRLESLNWKKKKYSNFQGKGMENKNPFLNISFKNCRREKKNFQRRRNNQSNENLIKTNVSSQNTELQKAI